MNTKLKLFLLCSICSLSIAYISCDGQDAISASQQNSSNLQTQRVGTSELSYAIKVKKTTDSLSLNMLKAGASQLKVAETATQIAFSYVTDKTFNLNGSDTDLSANSYVFDGVKLTISGVTTHGTYISGGKFYLSSPEYSGAMDAIGSTVTLSKNSILLLTTMAEITTPSTNKLPRSVITGGGGGCAFWNVYTYWGVGISSSSSQNACSQAQMIYGTSGCVAIGSMLTSCATDNHLCISTRDFCCD